MKRNKEEVQFARNSARRSFAVLATMAPVRPCRMRMLVCGNLLLRLLLIPDLTAQVTRLADAYVKAYVERYPENAAFAGQTLPHNDRFFDNSVAAVQTWQKQEDVEELAAYEEFLKEHPPAVALRRSVRHTRTQPSFHQSGTLILPPPTHL